MVFSKDISVGRDNINKDDASWEKKSYQIGKNRILIKNRRMLPSLKFVVNNKIFLGDFSTK